MGRQKIEIKRIIDKKKSYVTFSKRRQGLFKKMKDTASKYDVEIACIVFSECGRAYSFGSHQVDATIDKFMRDSRSTVPMVHHQEVEKRSNFERIRALIEEGKKCVSKDDNGLIGIDEMIKYRSDLQKLKDKLVEIRENCCSKKTYKEDSGEVSDSHWTYLDREGLFDESILVPHSLAYIGAMSDLGDFFDKSWTDLDREGPFDEHILAPHSLATIGAMGDLGETFDSSCTDSDWEGLFDERNLAPTSLPNIGAMSDSGEVFDSSWTDLDWEGLFDEHILAPHSFA